MRPNIHKEPLPKRIEYIPKATAAVSLAVLIISMRKMFLVCTGSIQTKPGSEMQSPVSVCSGQTMGTHFASAHCCRRAQADGISSMSCR